MGYVTDEEAGKGTRYQQVFVPTVEEEKPLIEELLELMDQAAAEESEGNADAQVVGG